MTKNFYSTIPVNLREISVTGILNRVQFYDKNVTEITLNIKILEMKLLFLLTALFPETRWTAIRNDDCLHRLTSVFKSQIPIIKDLTTDDVSLDCEVLKCLFNVLYQSIDEEMVKEVEKEMYSLLNNLRELVVEISLLKSIPENLKIELLSNTANLLTSVPDNCFQYLLFKTNEESEKNLYKDNEAVRFIQLIIDLIERRLNENTNLLETLSPLMHAMGKACLVDRNIRKYCRLKVLPYMKKEVMELPEHGNSIRNKLCKLLQHPCEQVTESVAYFLFILCKEDVERAIKYTGFGNFAGFLARHALLTGSKSHENTNYSDSEYSDTEEYLNVKDKVNPVTGRVEENLTNPLEGMSEEQKEYEVVQLMNQIDLLQNNMLRKPNEPTSSRTPYSSTKASSYSKCFESITAHRIPDTREVDKPFSYSNRPSYGTENPFNTPEYRFTPNRFAKRIQISTYAVSEDISIRAYTNHTTIPNSLKVNSQPRELYIVNFNTAQHYRLFRITGLKSVFKETGTTNVKEIQVYTTNVPLTISFGTHVICKSFSRRMVTITWSTTGPPEAFNDLLFVPSNAKCVIAIELIKRSDYPHPDLIYESRHITPSVDTTFWKVDWPTSFIRQTLSVAQIRLALLFIKAHYALDKFYTPMVVSFAAIDYHGRTLMETLVTPRNKLSQTRTHITKLSDEQLVNQMDEYEFLHKFRKLARGKILVGHDLSKQLIALHLHKDEVMGIRDFMYAPCITSLRIPSDFYEPYGLSMLVELFFNKLALRAHYSAPQEAMMMHDMYHLVESVWVDHFGPGRILPPVENSVHSNNDPISPPSQSEFRMYNPQLVRSPAPSPTPFVHALPKKRTLELPQALAVEYNGLLPTDPVVVQSPSEPINATREKLSATEQWLQQVDELDTQPFNIPSPDECLSLSKSYDLFLDMEDHSEFDLESSLQRLMHLAQRVLDRRKALRSAQAKRARLQADKECTSNVRNSYKKFAFIKSIKFVTDHLEKSLPNSETEFVDPPACVRKLCTDIVYDDVSDIADTITTPAFVKSLNFVIDYLEKSLRNSETEFVDPSACVRK